MPLIVDPALQASVIRQFNLRGELAPFNLTENVVPIFDIGTLLRAIDPTVVTTLAGSQGVRVGVADAQTFLPTSGPRYEDTSVTNSGATVNPAGGAVIVDTGQLNSGANVFQAIINWNAAILDFQIEWRNAANAATLATFGFQLGTGQPCVQFGPITLGMATDERLRIVSASGGVGTADATVIVAQFSASLAG